IYTTMEDCTADWVTPLLTAAEAPDPELVGIYEELYPLYVRTREALAPVWSAHAAVNRRADR
ncbi:MAG: carbohydrate kinase, partial [Alphaproteobacteria bacterium]|nr:carbohydrate kinase [Alphaproteobacteria bacterium]